VGERRNGEAGFSIESAKRGVVAVSKGGTDDGELWRWRKVDAKQAVEQ